MGLDTVKNIGVFSGILSKNQLTEGGIHRYETDPVFYLGPFVKLIV